MKNKKNISILLPIVLLIWGIVIYQFFSFSTPEASLENTSTEFKIKTFKLKERTPFAINVAYRDPFLGKMYVDPADENKKSVVKINKPTKPETPLVWPSIHYKGTIADTKDKKKIFVMIINGHNFYMKKGDTENEVFLKDGDKESVYVKYKGNLNLFMLGE